MITVKYTRKNNRFENDRYIIGVRRSNYKWVVSVIDKNTLDMTIKYYQRITSVSKFTEQFGIKVEV